MVQTGSSASSSSSSSSSSPSSSCLIFFVAEKMVGTGWSGKIKEFQVGSTTFINFSRPCSVYYQCVQVVLDNPSGVFFSGQMVEGRVVVFMSIAKMSPHQNHNVTMSSCAYWWQFPKCQVLIVLTEEKKMKHLKLELEGNGEVGVAATLFPSSSLNTSQIASALDVKWYLHYMCITIVSQVIWSESKGSGDTRHNRYYRWAGIIIQGSQDTQGAQYIRGTIIQGITRQYYVLVGDVPLKKSCCLFGHWPLGGGSKPLPELFGALFFTIRTIRSFKKCPKKVPESARLSARGV